MAGGHPDEVSGDTGPRMVFLPALPRSGEQLSRVQAVLKPLEDERLALPVYTSLDLLVESCGEQQPWVAVPEEHLEQVFHESSADVAMVNAALSEEMQWGDATIVHSLDEHYQARDEQAKDGSTKGSVDG